MATALIPGSFDPFTLGHLDLVSRAATAFETVIVAVTHNPAKNHALDFDTRVAVICDALDDAGLSERTRVEALPAGLLIDGARALGATHLVKGLRNSHDLAYEDPMSRMNIQLGDLDTFFLLTSATYAHVSSSLVREIHSLGGDISGFVPNAAHQALNNARA